MTSVSRFFKQAVGAMQKSMGVAQPDTRSVARERLQAMVAVHRNTAAVSGVNFSLLQQEMLECIKVRSPRGRCRRCRAGARHVCASRAQPPRILHAWRGGLRCHARRCSWALACSLARPPAHPLTTLRPLSHLHANSGT